LSKIPYPAALLAKLLVSAGLLYWLLRDIEFATILHVMRSADPWLLAVAFVIYFPGYLITASRWRTLIRAQGFDAPLGSLVRSFMVAIFFNNFLPSTIGGDVVRMYDSWKIIRSKSVAFAVVFMDRFFGVFALFSYALLALYYLPGVTDRMPLVGPLLLGGLLAALLVTLLVFSRAGLLSRQARRWQASHPNMLLRLLGKLLAAFAAYQGKMVTVLKVYGLSLLLQLNVVVHFIVIVLALDIDIPLLAMFLVVPVAVVVMMIPLSINGIGLREAVFVMMFGLFGVASEQAIALAWVAFAFTLAQGLIGGLLFAWRLYRAEPGQAAGAGPES
jgi:uncharacterized protein (TIRG00374 family)